MAGRRRNEEGNRRQQFEDDDEDTHVYCFVPGEGIDVVVLAAYLKRWVDGTATIQPTRHPKDPDRIGFTVGASSTLNREALEDLINDTRKWYKEQQTREFRRNPYDYSESDTFQDRKKKGPTAGSTAPKLAKPRDRKANTAEPADRRGAAAETGRGRHADVETDNPPPYGQQTLYGTRARSRSQSPTQPDPDAFRQLSVSDERASANQSARDRDQNQLSSRHAASGNTGSTNSNISGGAGGVKYVLKNTGNEQPKKSSGRHNPDQSYN